MTRLLLTFKFDARARWDRSADWRAAERARAESGTTSIRVSKAASKALAELGERIRATIPEKEKSRYFRERLTPDDLIAALAAGQVLLPAQVHETPAPDPAQLTLPVDVVHAQADPRASACNEIPVHAKSAAAAAACKGGDRRKVHATRDRTMHAKPSRSSTLHAKKGGHQKAHAKPAGGKKRPARTNHRRQPRKKL